jgi:hypothetical protein
MLGSFGAGLPFFSSGRLFSASMDGTTVTSHGKDGMSLWNHAFPSQVSAFAANEDMVIGGTVDGWLEAVNTTGERVLRFAPGGSRLPVILGVGVSPSSSWIAMLSGLDAQRLVVLGRGKSDYRVVSHRYLESAYREPARVAVLGDDRHVLYRQPMVSGYGKSRARPMISFRSRPMISRYTSMRIRTWLILLPVCRQVRVGCIPASCQAAGQDGTWCRYESSTHRWIHWLISLAEAIARLDFIKE